MRGKEVGRRGEGRCLSGKGETTVVKKWEGGRDFFFVLSVGSVESLHFGFL